MRAWVRPEKNCVGVTIERVLLVLGYWAGAVFTFPYSLPRPAWFLPQDPSTTNSRQASESGMDASRRQGAEGGRGGAARQRGSRGRGAVVSRAASQSGRGEGAGAVPVLVLVLVLVPVPVPVLVLVGASPCRPSSACFAARGLQRHARG